MTLTELAYERGLTVVETTSEANGYPKNLRKAVMDFADFAEAEEFAKECGGEIIQLHKRDGWQLWSRKGWTNEPLKITEADYGDDFEFIEPMDEAEFYAEYVEPFLADIENLKDLRAFVEAREELWDKVEMLEEDEYLVMWDGVWHETIRKEMLYWAFDTHHYAIAVVEES